MPAVPAVAIRLSFPSSLTTLATGPVLQLRDPQICGRNLLSPKILAIVSLFLVEVRPILFATGSSLVGFRGGSQPRREILAGAVV